MVPSVKDIIRWRYLLTVVLRVVSLLIIPLGFSRLGSWMLEGTVDGDLLEFIYYADRIASGLTLVVLGTVGVAAAGLVAQVLTPIPTARCPRCAYRLIGLQRPSCPECGQSLPAEFVDLMPAPARTQPAPPAAPLPPILTIDKNIRKAQPTAEAKPE